MDDIEDVSIGTVGRKVPPVVGGHPTTSTLLATGLQSLLVCGKNQFRYSLVAALIFV